MILKRLGRIITGGRRYIPEVDGLRFVAIMAVVLFHINVYTLAKHMDAATVADGEAWLVKLLSVGRYGVQLFFVLSGFLLALPFAKWRLGLGPHPSLRTYYLRRLTRLEPPYILSMLLLFLGGMVAFGVAVGLSHWPNLLASLFYMHGLIYETGSVINFVAWTLEVEVQFYILAPFLAVVFSIRTAFARRATILATMLALPFLRSFAPPRLFDMSLPGFLEFFIAGFLLADLFLVDWKEAPTHSTSWDLASLVGWPILLALMLSEKFPVLLAPAVVIAYIGAFRGKASSQLFGRPLLTIVGGMCYSMYLLHYAVISITGRVAKHFLVGSHYTSRLALESLVGLPAILIVTIVFYALIERPCMDPAWPSKLWQVWFRSPAGRSRTEREGM